MPLKKIQEVYVNHAVCYLSGKVLLKDFIVDWRRRDVCMS
jgi:hypothetical protein